MEITVENYQVSRISRLQIALQRIKTASTIEEAKDLATAYLNEDHEARLRQDKGDFNHPCHD